LACPSRIRDRSTGPPPRQAPTLAYPM
jgi:hypothetical protein